MILPSKARALSSKQCFQRLLLGKQQTLLAHPSVSVRKHLNNIPSAKCIPSSSSYPLQIRAMHSKSHYEAHTAATYESAFFYEEGDYSKYLCDLVVNRLCLQEGNKTQQPPQSRTLLDIGGGTGNFTRSISCQSGTVKSIVVDPFLPESQNDNKDNDNDSDDTIRFVKASAEEFMNKEKINPSNQWWRQSYHQILMKEVVHHFQDKDRVAIFRGMREGFSDQQLSDSSSYDDNNITQQQVPSLLIITRPQQEIDYPLWDAARDVWAKNQPHANDFVDELTTAGFSNVTYTIEAYPCAIGLERWQSMVKARFWSTFANFTDSELDLACKTIATSYQNRIDEDGQIHFEDRLVFISACK